MNTLQLTNVFLSLLSTYFFIFVISRNKSLEGGLNKTLINLNRIKINYAVLVSILLLVCSYALTMWVEYGVYFIQFCSVLGAVKIMLSSFKTGEAQKRKDEEFIKSKIKSLEFSVSFITKNYLADTKEGERKNKELKSILDKLELQLENTENDIEVKLNELGKMILEMEENQEKFKKSLIVLQGEVGSVDLNVKENIKEFKEEYNRDISELSENIKALNESIADLKLLLKTKEGTETKEEEEEVYIDPYIKAYLQG